jgi:hypothetical protein
MKLTDQQRRALTVLADMGPQGCLEGVMLMHGFGAGVMAGLVRDGLVSTAEETARAGRRRIYVAKVKITDAGRQAIES